MTVTAAKAGATIVVPTMGYPASMQVEPACTAKNDGNWYCATHRTWFANQLQKDSHITRGRHTLVWMCNLHGAEAP
jgi:hypothetical protein